MLAWGLWTVFARPATDSVLSETAMGISDATGALVAGTYIVATRKITTAVVDDGLFYAAFAGIAVVFLENPSGDRSGGNPLSRERHPLIAD